MGIKRLTGTTHTQPSLSLSLRSLPSSLSFFNLHSSTLLSLFFYHHHRHHHHHHHPPFPLFPFFPLSFLRLLRSSVWLPARSTKLWTFKFKKPIPRTSPFLRFIHSNLTSFIIALLGISSLPILSSFNIYFLKVLKPQSFAVLVLARYVGKPRYSSYHLTAHFFLTSFIR